ncbi:MAG: isoprenylcysteine carboxylmethyltransferase family protein [Gammaproteobacteria bacterium]|nr:isoprenylcysteine carboxylmethyltransferase family protein [Gammaproteobacteria bacterium]
MSIINPFALFSALCISAYWGTVVLKVVRIRAKIGKTPNVIPKESLGYISRAIMLPLIILWIMLPWQAAFSAPVIYSTLGCLGMAFCFIAYTASLYCWHYMGNSWRIGIDPKEKNTLITDGPFKHIRHPIYALSMLLMLGSLCCVQSSYMLALFAIHWFIFTMEALREERYLSHIYGETYQQYMKKTNRFLPMV